jgi:hypothetical protein
MSERAITVPPLVSRRRDFAIEGAHAFVDDEARIRYAPNVRYIAGIK